MGADIHVVLEQKHKGKWVGIDRYNYYSAGFGGNTTMFFPRVNDRNYRLFAALASVRGPGPEPKGIPDDASDLTLLKADEWEGDGHSWSWETLQDAARLWLEYDRGPEEMLLPYHPKVNDPYDYFFGVSRYDVEGDVDEGRAPGEYRVVFCFDN